MILDGPPLLAVSDPHTLAHDVDGVVLTARAGSTTRAQLTEAITALNQVGANVLGVVLVAADRNETYVNYDHQQRVPPAAPTTAGGNDQLWRNPTGPVIDLDRSGGRACPSGQRSAALTALTPAGGGADGHRAAGTPRRRRGRQLSARPGWEEPSMASIWAGV